MHHLRATWTRPVSPQEALFPSIYFLFDNRILERDVRFLVLHTLFTW